MNEEKTKRYVVVDKTTTQVVAEGIKTRQAARIAKRELEYKNKADNQFRPVPSRYYVETDVDHPSGAGIYYH